MHIAKANAVWHCYTKVKAGVCYGIITKRVDGVVEFTVKETFSTRKDAKKAITVVFKQLASQ